MAKAKKKEPDPVVRDFIAAIMGKLRITKARDLADLLSLKTRDSEVTVGRWVRGVSAPNFHHTMELLTKAGWLKEPALRAYRQAAPHGVTEAEADQSLRRVETGSQPPGEQAGPTGTK